MWTILLTIWLTCLPINCVMVTMSDGWREVQWFQKITALLVVSGLGPFYCYPGLVHMRHFYTLMRLEEARRIKKAEYHASLIRDLNRETQV